MPDAPANLADKHFGHRVQFIPSRKDARTAFVMFKDASLLRSRGMTMVGEFGLLPMVLPEAQAMTGVGSNLDIDTILNWFAREAQQAGIVPSSSLIMKGTFSLPIVSTEVSPGGTLVLNPWLHYRHGQMGISLKPDSHDLTVGEAIYPCVCVK